MSQQIVLGPELMLERFGNMQADRVLATLIKQQTVL